MHFGRLRDDKEVDNAVKDSGASEQTENKKSCGVGRVGEDVDETKNQERNYVLDVILMCSSNSFNIFVYPNL